MLFPPQPAFFVAGGNFSFCPFTRPETWAFHRKSALCLLSLPLPQALGGPTPSFTPQSLE